MCEDDSEAPEIDVEQMEDASSLCRFKEFIDSICKAVKRLDTVTISLAVTCSEITTGDLQCLK